MTQMNTPEVTLAKAQEFLKTNDDDNTIVIINDFIQNSKKKYWTQNHEQLISVLIEVAIRKNNLKFLKDGLNYYRGISQNTNIDSLANILTKTKELVEDKFMKAQKSYQGIKIDIQDLDSEDSPELLFLYSFEDIIDSKEKEDFINSQKFIWETYKILLDLTKTNSKLLSLYGQILKSAFNFCKENKRKVEFKRLCDSVRGYLQTLIKTEKKQFFQNKVQISRPEVLKILIQIRISLLDTATELEQWQEAFKTAEDIIFLMDKYEKQISDDKSKKSIKIPPLMKLEFFHNIEKLLWISDYHLYHAHATILVKELAAKAEKWIKGAKNVEKLKDAKQKLEKFDVENVNNKIILATLVTPFKNSYTNYVNIGSELFEHEREIETQTCSRMMGILKLSVVPSKKNLINFIQSNKLLDETSVDPNIKSLYNLLIEEKNPLVIGKKSFEIINYLKNNEKFAKFADLLNKNLLIRGLDLLSRNYDSITISRLEKIFPFVKSNQNLDFQDIISESSRTGIFTCTIDIARNLIKFKSDRSTLNKFNDTLSTFINSVATVTSKIIKSNKSNENKFSAIRNVIYKDIHSHNTNSLYIYDNLISSMEQSSQKLELHLREKEKFKETLRETQAKIRKEQKEKKEEEDKMMREILKDEQKKKEFDIQLKKYLIDRVRIYTNVLFIDGKKVKLDDLLKDLNKITDEQLIKLLEKEEYEFKTKKEKKFRQTAKDTDYIIREFRKRDFEVYMKSTQDEEQKYNELVEEEEKKSYTEKIGFKANLLRFKKYKDGYFNEILNNREREYEEKMQEFTQSLHKKIQEDLLKEIGPVFKTYVEDFRKRQEEDQAKQGSAWKPNVGKEMFMKKGGNFVKTDDKPRSTLTSGFGEFKKGANFAPTKDEPKPMLEKPLEFKKGEKFVIPTEVPITKIEFTRSTKTVEIPITKEPEKKDTGFKRAEKTEPTPSTEFSRGSAIKKEEPKLETTSFPKRGEAIKTEKSEKIETTPIIRKAPVEQPKTTPQSSTPSTSTGGFSRGANVEQPKTTTQSTQSTQSSTPSTSTGGFSRGANVQQPAKTTTPSTNSTTKKPEESKPSGSAWRK